MASENNNERIRQAVERSTPALSPEVRKRALWAVMSVLRRRPRLRTAGLVVLVLLLLAAAVYARVHWFTPKPPGRPPAIGLLSRVRPHPPEGILGVGVTGGDGSAIQVHQPPRVAQAIQQRKPPHRAMTAATGSRRSGSR